MQRIAHNDAREALNLLASMKITLYDLGWQDVAEVFSIASSLDLRSMTQLISSSLIG
ncbi:MAG: hypothetical protein ACUVTD_07820 [Nitrososphaerales archaeon]